MKNENGDLNKRDWKKVEAGRNRAFKYLVKNPDTVEFPEPTEEAKQAYEKFLQEGGYINSYEFPDNGDEDWWDTYESDNDLFCGEGGEAESIKKFGDNWHDIDAYFFEQKNKKHPFPEWVQSQNFLDILRARVPASKIISRYVPLKQRRGSKEFRGLSPFKIEKKPSFFVNDQKGAWFDFTTGDSGDIFSFIQKARNISFLGAVLYVIKEAGYRIPKKNETLEKYLSRQPKDKK